MPETNKREYAEKSRTTKIKPGGPVNGASGPKMSGDLRGRTARGGLGKSTSECTLNAFTKLPPASNWPKGPSKGK